jgi:L-aminoadipate-semialdehyde dehydrogenase
VSLPKFILNWPNIKLINIKATNTDDFLVRMLKGCIQLSQRPNINNTVNMVPVDHVARVVVSSTLFPPTTPLGVSQVTGTPRLRFNEFLGCLETYGYDTKLVDYIPWKTSLERYISSSTSTTSEPAATSSHNLAAESAEGQSVSKYEDHALLPLYHFVTADLPTSTKAPELDDTHARKSLALDVEATGLAIGKTSVDEDLVGLYLAYLVKVGFLPAPTKEGKKQLPKADLSAEQLGAMKGIGGRGAA